MPMHDVLRTLRKLALAQNAQVAGRRAQLTETDAEWRACEDEAARAGNAVEDAYASWLTALESDRLDPVSILHHRHDLHLAVQAQHVAAIECARAKARRDACALTLAEARARAAAHDTTVARLARRFAHALDEKDQRLSEAVAALRRTQP